MKKTFGWLNTGLQTFQHAFRMGMQALTLLVLLFISGFVLSFVAFFFHATNQSERYDALKTLEVAVRWEIIDAVATLGSPSLIKSVNRMRYHDDIITATSMMKTISWSRFSNRFTKVFVTCFKIGLLAGFLTVFLLLIYFIKRGEKLKSDKIIRGATEISSEELTKEIKRKYKNFRIELAGVPMPTILEVEHYLFNGSTGTGKTQNYIKLLTQIRQNGQSAIVVDPEGIFVSLFYNESKDIILNSFDERSPAWNIWAECQQSADYTRMAESIIPMTHKSSDEQAFWIKAARTIFEVTANIFAKQKNFNTQALIRACVTSDMKLVEKMAKGTIGESLMAKGAEKLALSVKSMLTTYIRGLAYIKDPDTQDDAFSIRDWVKSEPKDSILFLTSTEETHAVLRPIISAQLETAATALLTLPESKTRRLWFLIDELPTLHRLPCLTNTMARGRKRGCAVAIGIQGESQLSKYYGLDAAKEILNLTNTKFYYRSPDAESAKAVSDALGEYEVETTQEGLSYSANDNRDNVSLHEHTTVKKLFLPSEITDLPKLHAILHITDGLPRARVKVEICEKPVIAESYIPSNIVHRDTLMLIDTVEPTDNEDQFAELKVSKRKSELTQNTSTQHTFINETGVEPPGSPIKESSVTWMIE